MTVAQALAAYTPPRKLPVRPATLPPALAATAAGAPSERISSQARSAGAAQLEQVSRSVQESRVKVRDDTKARARAKLNQLTEQLRLAKNLHASNPKEYARQLARLARELQDELKSYARATRANADHVSAEGEVATAAGQAQAEREARAVNAQGDLSFYKEVRGFLSNLRGELESARIGAAATPKDRKREADPIEDADKALKDIQTMLKDMQVAAEEDIPPPGTLVSRMI